MRNCWITLGAYGDCCNTLPLVWNDFQQGNRPTMMIAEQFSSLLDGVSYCDRLVYHGHYSESAKAADMAQGSGKFDNVYLCQCYGTTVERGTDSYAKESWRLVERLHLWDSLPLVFDLRDEIREGELMMKIGDRGKPKVLVATKGKSSPFGYRDQLMEILSPMKDEIDFIDLDGFSATRFYDLIVLMERSMALITTDSGCLHLAQAVPKLPVVALVTHLPDSWHGSPRRASHVFNCRYNQFLSRRSEIPQVLGSIMRGMAGPRLVHVYSDYDHRSDDAEHRHQIARLSWKREYDSCPWIPVPVHDSTLHRTSLSIGEQKPVPFLKDIINRGAEACYDNDIIVLTNDDTVLAPGSSEIIKGLIANHGVIWGARQELVRIKQPPSIEEMKKGYKHCGADVFAFTKAWWRENSRRLPDFLISFECWDLSFRTLISLTGGTEALMLCAHQIHQPYWHTNENRECAGNLYNRDLCRQFFRDNRMPWPT